MTDLRPFFAPRSIAVVGAGERPTSSGGAVMQMIARAGYRGRVVPVNPRGGRIFGHDAVAAIGAVSPPADLVVVVVRPDAVVEVVREAAAAGHRHVLVLPGGFAEAGEEGRARDAALRAVVAETGITVAGPNCAGLIHMDAAWPHAPTFFRDLPPGPGPRGGIAFVSQSGALIEEAIARANAERLPVSTLVSVGNGLQLGIEDHLEHLGADPAIAAVLLYIESVADPRRLRAIARRVAATKPVVALFGGATAPGAAAAAAHTGAAANDDAAIEAYAADCGLLRVRSLADLLLAAKGFGFHPDGLPGRRVLVLSNSGGPGVLTSDRASAGGLDLVPLPAAMTAALRVGLPPEAAVANPLDLLADAREDRFVAALEAALAAGRDAFDAILGIHVVPFMVDAGPVIAALASLATRTRAAGLPFLHSMMGTLEAGPDWFRAMENAGVPMFADSERMATCAALLARYPALRARVAAAPVDDATAPALKARR
ncbi:MAG: CoA-binding protein [Alphaproteobacteria bacterium]